MISLDIKPEASSPSSLLALVSKKETPTLSFADLLKGVSLKQDTQLIQNGAFVVSLEKDFKELPKDKKLTQNDTLLSLLKDDGIPQKEIPQEINPKIVETLNVTEFKTLIHDAKKYLKNKILQSDGFKNAEIQVLPKTLKGLAQVAQKFGIDISKITIEEVQRKSKLETKIDVKQLLAKNESPHLNTQTKSTHPNENVQDTKLEKIEKKTQGVQTLKSTPLFQAQTKTEHTTEQLVQTKILSTDKKTPKHKADETLKSLLSGDKTLKKDTTLTADFAVASAKVIAPKVVRETSNAFESLLKGDNTDATDVNKLDGFTTSKADSFEVKINEAKQMTKYLSQDVKTAIEDYKSPFTRLKVQLNPQKLGEIDLTIVQRGKNLHINLSSNNVAINALAMNAQDLKTQLANSGINNASLNFSNNPQSDQSGANQQHQQRHQEQKAQDEYNYFERQEKNEEILSSLEIVVPHYA